MRFWSGWHGKARLSPGLLEMPATVLGVLVTWLYARTLAEPDRPGPVRALGWTLTAFALTAAQYATLSVIVSTVSTTSAVDSTR